MKLFSTVFVLVSVAVCGAELIWNATEGENATIPIKTAGLERAYQVTATFTRENQKNLIARYCCCAQHGDCNPVKTQGVSLKVEEATLTLFVVNSSNSGLYEVKIIRNIVSEIKFTLVVNKPQLSSSRAPTQPSIPKPPNASERQRLYLLIALVVFILVVLAVCFFCKCMRKCKSEADVEVPC